MNFIPEQPEKAQEVPYYDDVTSEGGWQGHETTKSVDRLRAEVTKSLERLEAAHDGSQRGMFMVGKHKRPGFRISWLVERPDGTLVQGRLDIAALPVRDHWRYKTSVESRQEKSLRMALYMVRMALDGTWFLQQLSPGYAPLMPFLLADGERTISQMWAESETMRNLLPPGSSDFEEGEFREE